MFTYAIYYNLYILKYIRIKVLLKLHLLFRRKNCVEKYVLKSKEKHMYYTVVYT